MPASCPLAGGFANASPDEMETGLGAIEDMAESLQAPVDDFDRVVSLLEETVSYIERLDRKRGPRLRPPLGR